LKSIVDFIIHYDSTQEQAIAVVWNKQDTSEFIDINFKFRKQVNKSVIYSPNHVPLDLVRDLYKAEITYAKKSGLISVQVHHLAEILLGRGKITYLRDFLAGRYGGSVNIKQGTRVSLGQELTLILLDECQKRLDTAIDNLEHDLWQDGINLFSWEKQFAYPDWFYRKLVENSLPWDLGRETSWSNFNSMYTLHDSGWGELGIFQHINYLVLVINWDVVWVPETVRNQIQTINSRVFLLIELAGVEEISVLENKESNVGFLNTIVGDELIEVNGKKILSIIDAAGGDVDIIYTGSETFLAMVEDGSILEL
jgi:hypothetical protein